ncbi:MAG: DUF4838 domain-containing protein [Treponema sp.]|nr:DUF4838 domain-containing protein [Treponema sp.]
MANFYASKEWVILFPPDVPEIKKAAGDMSRYIGLLAGLEEGLVQKPPALMDAHGPAPSEASPIIVLNSEGSGPERNGFSWRAGTERIEIYGESGRGLCNGIYSFLSALGLSWPGPGQEILPSSQVANLRVFPISTIATGTVSLDSGVFEPSRYVGNAVAAPWRRFTPAGKDDVKSILKKPEVFAAWAARRRYDALIFPLTAFASGSAGKKLNELRKAAAEYGIALETGGRELSSLVPRRFFLLHRDFFRMEGGGRKRDHHFCPTNPGTIRILGKEAEKLFRAAGETKVFHLWPDKGANTAWCSCPTCRAFTPAEQNRIGANAAADVLAAVNPGASLTFFEKPGEGGSIPLRENLFKMEKLPDEKEYR